MRGRLNLFQRTMLRWRELHPYSAVHVVRVDQRLEPSRLREAIADELMHFGLTGFALDPGRRRFEYRGGQASVTLQILQADGDPPAVLRAEIERQLNLPFPDSITADPFRFFVVDEAASFWLCLVYDHYVAGGDSIVPLLGAIVGHYTLPAGRSAFMPVPDLYPVTYRRLVLRNPVQALRAMSGAFAMLARSRRCFRPRIAADDDTRVAFSYHRIGSAQLEGLLRTAKALGVTFNDLLVSCLLLALSPAAEGRREATQRTELAVAAIANIRQDFEVDSAGSFGQFLASFSISHPVPEGIELAALARDVHQQTINIKRNKLYLQSILALSLPGLLWPFLSNKRRHRFYPKHFPVWAGITTLNVNALWRPIASGNAPEYLRAVPTGPLCPLVIAATTSGDALHLGVSYRTAAFTRSAAENVIEAFVHGVDILAAMPAA